MDCPNCRKPMLKGYLYSGFSMYWLYSADAPARRLFGLGQRLQDKPLMQVTGDKIEGWHCHGCDHVLIAGAALEPPSS